MGNRIIICFLICLLSIGTKTNAQQSLWFGIVKMQDKITQGRFEVFYDKQIKTIVYAPYGITPTTFMDVKQQDNQLTFSWKYAQSVYHCLLVKQDSSVYKGNCNCKDKQPIQLTIREFTKEDAILQGDSLHASQKDIQILDRAMDLLNNGINWNRTDNRICDNSSYPYKWSLFCALHQASIDVDSEYRHLRPAIQAARQAIDQITNGKKYPHLLQDFNNEALSFESIAQVLNRAKEIIAETVKSSN
jgi:hypothetical protein